MNDKQKMKELLTEQVEVFVTDISNPYCFTMVIGKSVKVHMHAKTLLLMQQKIGEAFLQWANETTMQIIKQMMKS